MGKQGEFQKRIKKGESLVLAHYGLIDDFLNLVAEAHREFPLELDFVVTLLGEETDVGEMKKVYSQKVNAWFVKWLGPTTHLNDAILPTHPTATQHRSQ